MPELPEVETIVRTLAPRLAGRRLIEMCFFSRLVLRGRPEELAERLRGRKIRALSRRGKFLVLEFDGGPPLTIHLGMTGQLLWQGAPGPHTRAVFELDGGRLVYNDIRQFGRIELGDSRLRRLGPDPLAISEQELAGLLRQRRARLKSLLLDQRFLGGLGNIYADEILFRARIHPCAIAARLSAVRVRKLHRTMRDVLRAAIRDGGSSVSNYVDAEGHTGAYQRAHQVYRKTGLPCPACGAPIRRALVAQRSTHYCPRCQRM